MYNTMDDTTIKRRPNITKPNTQDEKLMGTSCTVTVDYEKEWEFAQMVVKELQEENETLRKALVNLALKI